MGSAIRYIVATFGGWVTSFMMPVAHFMVFVVVLVICDFGTGVAAAKKRRERLRSRGFMRSVLKIVFYFIAILLSHGMDVVYLHDANISFSFTYVVAGFISLTEFKSNLENISVLTGTDVWSHVMSRIPKIFRGNGR